MCKAHTVCAAQQCLLLCMGVEARQCVARLLLLVLQEMICTPNSTYAP